MPRRVSLSVRCRGPRYRSFPDRTLLTVVLRWAMIVDGVSGPVDCVRSTRAGVTAEATV